MKISYNWLKNYVKTEHSPERLSEILTDTGLEVEGLEKVEIIKGGLEGVVIGHVTKCVPHEGADRLNVTSVDIGEAEEVQIVCGAPNVAEGQKVVVATVGTTLFPNPDESFKIKKAKIRGVESFGMICAEDELGMGVSHDGIMVLPKDAKIGQKAADFFNLADDYRIEIGLTPNRSDALGHLGVARDIVAFNKVHKTEKSSLQLPDISAYKVVENGEKVKIEVRAPDDCIRYLGCVISNIKVKPSPDWLKNYLLTIGLSPINNVVDVTNFVMHELGTPLHAFDLSKVGEKIVVKHAEEGELFTTLDGVERKLSDQDLMITNGSKNLCIAGVFGGLNSGVSSETTSIFLESAYFNPVSVRKTAKRHGLNTDASFRFERGVDVKMIEFAMKRAATLIAKLSDGSISHEPIPFYPKRIKSKEVTFSYSRCNQLIGNKIDAEKVGEILNALDIQILQNNGDRVQLKIPTYRVDVTREADVIEEVLRIYGFNNIELPEKWNISLSDQNLRSEEMRLNTIADLLVSQGYFEMMNNSLTSSNFIVEHGGEVFSNDNSVKMLNPLSLDLDVMRQSLIFQGLTTVVHNKNRQNSDLGLFEFGKIYQKFNAEFIENKRLSIFLTGAKQVEQWNSNQGEVSFFTLKGIVTSILERLGLDALLSTKALKKSILEDGIQLYIQKDKIGEIGWTSNKMNKSLGLKQRVYIADLDWDMILSLGNRNKTQFKPLPKAFEVRRDYSLLLDKSVTFQQIEEIARKTDRKLLKEVKLFDVYEGDKLPENKKSYAVSFHFQDNEKTLKDVQIDKIMEDIRKQLESQLKAELRS
ncbi:phenylalanine--tRNA ligase subunit beta [Brumimicrobium mesophilum]|uniref:phenylalanine--tRNA ligase subunit beta n=1 Tax=Brumimicrobium mesophilum TaxID=392717 RepID=UPI000D13F0F6|nr:phenylalanine--tRNA ligase subunit beta [Brumimicrobium mesophilum]